MPAVRLPLGLVDGQGVEELVGEDDGGPQRRRAEGCSRCRYVQAESALETTMSEAILSPEASVTPVAAPLFTSMEATSALQRTSPPCPSISPTSPETSFPMPPIAKCTP